MSRWRQLRSYKQVSCLCLQMRQTSSDDFNCVLLLLIIKCINPCIVLNYGSAAVYSIFCVHCAQTGERVGRGWMLPVMAIMRSKLECFHFRVLYLPPSCTSLLFTTPSPLSNCHYCGSWESENANLATVRIKLWTSNLQVCLGGVIPIACFLIDFYIPELISWHVCLYGTYLVVSFYFSILCYFVCFLLGSSLASEFYMPTLWLKNSLSLLAQAIFERNFFPYK